MPYKNKEKERAYQKEYRAAHAKENRAYHKIYRDRHRKAALEYAKKYRKNNPEEVQEYNRKRREDAFLHQRSRYGVDAEKFYVLLVSQDGRCAICRELFVGTPNIDHDHSCCGPKNACEQCRRGLLCRQCNAGLGGLRDSIEILSRAIDYLRKYESRKTREIIVKGA